jgi:hypothetical protein
MLLPHGTHTWILCVHLNRATNRSNNQSVYHDVSEVETGVDVSGTSRENAEHSNFFFFQISCSMRILLTNEPDCAGEDGRGRPAWESRSYGMDLPHCQGTDQMR